MSIVCPFDYFDEGDKCRLSDLQKYFSFPFREDSIELFMAIDDDLVAKVSIVCVLTNRAKTQYAELKCKAAVILFCFAATKCRFI